MVVWIVNPYDNLPLEGYRPQRYWLMARAFARAGHEVTLWTSDFSHAHKSPRAVHGEVKGDGFAVKMVPTPPYPRNICLRRILSHRAFARRWRSLAEGEAPPDMVVASLPPLSLGKAAAAFCRRAGAKFVVDVQDAWPETFERIVPRFILAPLRATARRVYRAADAVSGVARIYLDLAASYGARAPMHLAPLGAELPRAEAAPSPAPDGVMRLVYAGNMGRSYDLATVVEAVKGEPSLHLDLAGAGPDEAALRARAAGCPRIVFHGYLEAAPLRELLATADAGLVPMFDDSLVGLPGKLADYSAAGLPILNSLSGETAALIAEHSAGFTYKAGSVESLLDAAAKLRVADRAALRAGAASLAAVFDAEAIYPAYVSWAEKIQNSQAIERGKTGGGQ